MKKKICLILFLTVFLVSTHDELFFLRLTSADSITIRVPQDYASIQEAINAANQGDTILVAPGIYYENLVVNKSISVIAQERGSSVIDGNNTGTAVSIQARNVTLSGFVIQNGNYPFDKFAIVMAGVSILSGGVVLNNSVIRYNPYGIISIGDNIISGNEVANNEFGIGFQGNNSKVIGNKIMNNSVGIVLPVSSYNITIKGNTFKNNRLSLEIAPFGLLSLIHNIDSSNVVDGKPVYYWVNQHNKKVPTNAGYVAVINSSNILVKDLTLTNIHFAYTNQSTIENVKIISHDVFTYHHPYYSMDLSSLYGVSLYASTGNTVRSNTITNSSGIHLFSYTELGGPRITKNNSLVGNVIVGRATGWQVGICLDSSTNNTITRNTISNCSRAIWLQGITEGNVIFHNNLLNNTQQVGISSEPVNIWDNGYPSGGNYWSDYTGVDEYSGPYQNETGSDGIGDTPYVIDERNQDNYPLMEPWTESSWWVVHGTLVVISVIAVSGVVATLISLYVRRLRPKSLTA